MALPLHNDMLLYTTQHSFLIEPRGMKEHLIIDRITGNVTLNASEGVSHLPIVGSETRPICGIIGLITCVGGPYLVAVKHRVPIGWLENQEIYRLAGVYVIPLREPSFQQEVDDRLCTKAVENVLGTPFFYFSYSYDLTQSMQRCRELRGSTSMYERADTRFVWNHALLEEWYRPEFQRYCLPLMHGFMCINGATINGHNIGWALISRRSRERAGTRLFTRGINSSGQVANYVETEQIIACGSDRVSFVQTRGSIPLYWQQTPNLAYKPAPQILPEGDHLIACSKHFYDQCNRYGRQVLINLVDQRGAEGALAKAYEDTITALANPALRYEAFDFHRECRKLRYDRVSLLMDRIAAAQDEFGVYHCSVYEAGRPAMVHSLQRGVFRTNCIDCLDRTNVVQSELAKRSLEQTLIKLHVLDRGTKHIEPKSSFDTVFKAVWADNADLISLQYSGTRALKTDFTRIGKRTVQGMLRDGRSSLIRYCYNNFADGVRQDEIDFFLGTFREPGGRPIFPIVPRQRSRAMTILICLTLPIAVGVMLIIFSKEYTSDVVIFFLCCMALAVFILFYIRNNPLEFVDWPQLDRLKQL
ncbi:phosphatidylinositol-3-phosphatase SAC1-like [Anopheles albimanus]|nr:phosphatidylinositol-3-phosphatase SAC1-like [Anopheles albimanus]